MSQPPPLIAVVDDEESIRRALDRLLRSAGFAVETFASGAEFLRSVLDHRPACVVLDLHMPELSGLDVQLFLTRDRVQVPVIMVTGHETPEARARLMARGAAACLRKPVDDKVLLAAIEDAIRSTTQISSNQDDRKGA
jgi:two-component system response regulator FixJ